MTILSGRMEKISGIYEIINKLNGHRYVGSSSRIYHRWFLHRFQLRKGNHHSVYLQRAWNKYGEKPFEFNMLEECEPVNDTLLLLEQKYIDGLNPEYNILLVAERPVGFVRTVAFRKKQSLAKKGKPFKYRSEESRKQKKINSSISALNSDRVKGMKKPIIMLDKKTEKEIKEFDSILDAAYFLGKRNKQVNIGLVANGKRKTASGYKWKFKNIENDLS